MWKAPVSLRSGGSAPDSRGTVLEPVLELADPLPKRYPLRSGHPLGDVLPTVLVPRLDVKQQGSLRLHVRRALVQATQKTWGSSTMLDAGLTARIRGSQVGRGPLFDEFRQLGRDFAVKSSTLRPALIVLPGSESFLLAFTERVNVMSVRSCAIFRPSIDSPSDALREPGFQPTGWAGGNFAVGSGRRPEW